jgi:hypothetical protein
MLVVAKNVHEAMGSSSSHLVLFDFGRNAHSLPTRLPDIGLATAFVESRMACTISKERNMG